MPQGNFTKVYSVSSEDAAFPATNLLKRNSGKKWKTKEVGEKSAYVVLQFDKPEKITGIDIGNEFSSFIMVLVGRPTYSSDDFKEILITCSFMTPIESKNSTNINRVRCFAANSLVEDVAREKWDLVKIVCTQPFNRHIQYGLSFVTVHVAESKEMSSQASSAVIPKPVSSLNQLHVASFKLREDSPDSEAESSSGLFNRWKQSRKDPISAAASIRAASRAIEANDARNSPTTSRIEVKMASKANSRMDLTDEKPKDRNRHDLLYDKVDDSPNERLEKKIAEDRNRLQKEKDTVEHQKKKQNSPFPKNKDTSTDARVRPLSTSQTKKHNAASSSQKDESCKRFDKHDKETAKTSEEGKTEESSRKRASSSKSERTTPAKKVRQEKPVQFREFRKLLQGVVLVISGIQNPDRGDIRQKAVELGAKYKPDWDDSCTHLICAFKNTPKYNQVRGKGKIVTRSWIEKCHSLKKRLPWRRFALDDREAEKPESEDEIFDVSLKPADVEPEVQDDVANEAKDSSRLKPASPVKQKTDASPREKDICQQTPISDDDVIMQYDNDQESHFVSSGSDTDEDIQKALKTKSVENGTRVEATKVSQSETATPSKNRPPASPSGSKKNKNFLVYEASTDEDENLKIPNEDTDSPTLFEGLSFHIKDNLSATDSVKVKQYIEQFKGQLVEDLSDADYVISREKIHDKIGFKGEVVNPLWVFECYDMECRIPTRRYLL